MTPEQFDRLPRFARDEMVRLRRDLDRAREQVAGLEAKLSAALCDKPTDTEVEHYGGTRVACLRDDAQIRFRMTDGVTDYITVRRAADGAGVEIRGGEPVVVRPEVSNVVSVYLRNTP
jgi:hypothetical protein